MLIRYHILIMTVAIVSLANTGCEKKVDRNNLGELIYDIPKVPGSEQRIVIEPYSEKRSNRAAPNGAKKSTSGVKATADKPRKNSPLPNSGKSAAAPKSLEAPFEAPTGDVAAKPGDASASPDEPAPAKLGPSEPPDSPTEPAKP